ESPDADLFVANRQEVPAVRAEDGHMDFVRMRQWWAEWLAGLGVPQPYFPLLRLIVAPARQDGPAVRAAGHGTDRMTVPRPAPRGTTGAGGSRPQARGAVCPGGGRRGRAPRPSQASRAGGSPRPTPGRGGPAGPAPGGAADPGRPVGPAPHPQAGFPPTPPP